LAKNTSKLLVTSMLFVFLCAGCSLLNPYEKEFSCPQKEKGKCVSVKDAYKESLHKKWRINSGNTEDSDKEGTGNANEGEPAQKKEEVSVDSQKREYEQAVFGKLKGLLKEPETPMITAPKIMRVLLLPYKGQSNELYMSRYIYFIADQPKWIMGDYLMPREDE